MGLYEWMPAIKSIATNTNAVATREKYATFVRTSESAWFFIMTHSLKKSPDLGERQRLTDEAWRVT
jgi:hypothetical protein